MHSCAMKYFFSSIIFIRAITFLGVLGEVRSDRPPEVVKKSQCETCGRVANNPTIANTCYQAGYGSHPYWCCECPAGTYVNKNCSDDEPLTTQCKTCEPGTYTLESNHLGSCIKSKISCNHLPYTRFEKGSTTEDHKCICIDGTFSPYPEISGCKKHNECPKGFGVKALGNSTHDSKCEKCEEGMCADEESSTQMCQRCVDVSSNETDVSSSEIISTAEHKTVRPTTERPTEGPGGPQPLHSNSNQGLLALMFILGLLIGAALCFLVIFLCRRHQRKKRKAKKNKERLQKDEEQEERNGGGNVQESSFIKDPPKAEDKKDPEKEHLLKPDPQDDSPSMDKKSGAYVAILMPEGQNKEKKDKDGSIEEDKALEEERSPASNEAVPCETEDPDPKSKTANLTEDQFKKIFSDKGYLVTYNPDLDGHCQFAAIFYQRNCGNSECEMTREEVQKKAKEMRRDIVEHMKNRKHAFEGFNVGDWDSFIKEMSESKYGEHSTLKAACEMYGISFKIIQTSNKNGEPVTIQAIDESQSETAENPILLGHIGEEQGSHYVCLAPKPSDDASNVLFAKTPVSDGRVEQDLQLQHHNPRPTYLNVQSSSEVPVRRDPTEEPVQNAQLEPAPVVNGPSNPHIGSVSSDVDPDLDLFDNQVDRTVLAQIAPDELHHALESSDYLREMLTGRSGIHRSTSSSDLKFFIRQNRLLDDVSIEDIEKENSDGQKELRWKLAKQVVAYQGLKLTPRKLLKMSLEYEKRHFYDELCKAFIKHLDNSRTAA